MNPTTLSNQIQALFPLNEMEFFLKEFLEEYPEYTLNITDTDEKYTLLYKLLKKKWNKRFDNKEFFLTENTSYIKEDFFFSADENVTMRKNLRYMPFIMHSHQFIEINYVLNSAGSFMITQSGRHPLANGDIILCPPNFVHCFDTHNNDSIIMDFFIRITTFDTAFFQLLSHDNYLSTVFSNALYNSEGNYILWHCGEDDELKDLIISSFDEWTNSKNYRNQMLEANALRFFILLMRNYEHQAIFAIPPVSSSDSVFQTFYNYMLFHCKSVSLSSLASQFGYSERQVIRILKKNSGKGFSELLLDIRMNRAIELLKNPSMTISQISALLGYSSITYFQQVFFKTFSFKAEDFKVRMMKDFSPS